MSVDALLSDLQQRGVTVYRRGDNLRLRPKVALTPELLQAVKDHKAELLDLLGREDRQVSDVQDALRERGHVTLWSETLGCEVVWTVDRRRGLLPSGTVRYTLSELAELVKGNVEPEGLRMIHTAKALFDGQVTRVEGVDSGDA